MFFVSEKNDELYPRILKISLKKNMTFAEFFPDFAELVIKAYVPGFFTSDESKSLLKVFNTAVEIQKCKGIPEPDDERNLREGMALLALKTYLNDCKGKRLYGVIKNIVVDQERLTSPQLSW